MIVIPDQELISLCQKDHSNILLAAVFYVNNTLLDDSCSVGLLKYSIAALSGESEVLSLVYSTLHRRPRWIGSGR